jgi:hypothetical protein
MANSLIERLFKAARPALILVAGLVAPARAQVHDWPGAWVEIETGNGDVARRNWQYGSAGFVADWREQAGTILLDLEVPAKMTDGILYLRYGRDSASKSAGAVQLHLGPAGATASSDPGVRSLGEIQLPHIGHLNAFHWVRLPVKDLTPGRQRLIITAPKDSSPGMLDVVGLVPAETRGLWTPPIDVRLGRFVGSTKMQQPFEVIQIERPTVGGLLPDPIYAGAEPVEITLKLRNHLLTDPAKVKVGGILRSSDGTTADLPEQQIELPPAATTEATYRFPAPGMDRFEAQLTLAGEGREQPQKVTFRRVAQTPVWQAADVRMEGPDTKRSIAFTLEQATGDALIYVLYERSWRERDSAPMDIYLAPAGETDPQAQGVRKLGTVTLQPQSGRDGDPRWAVVNAGSLSAGKHTLITVLREPVVEAKAGQRVRYPDNTIRMIGIVPGVDRGLWLPPANPAQLRTADGQRRDPVRLSRVNARGDGNLYLDTEYLGPQAKPLPLSATIVNQVVTAPVECVLRPRLINDHGVVAELPEIRRTLAAAEQATIDITPTAPGHGWFALEVNVEAEGISSAKSVGFGVLRPPARGVRPDSMFGLAVGQGEMDAKVSELIGVKWRRGVPDLAPQQVLVKSGDLLHRKPEDTVRWWNESEIQKARNAVAQWREHGVLCLGFVSYNIPWNCLDLQGSAWHKNRPADMRLHTDMVYHMIKPLADEVKYWEIWNEPWVGGWTWGTGTGADYREMARMIWERVKPEMPDVMIIGGGSTPYQRDVLFPINTPDVGYVDGVSTHPYGKPDTNHASFAALEREMLRKHSMSKGAGGIWATELGTAPYMFKPLTGIDADMMVARTVAPLYLLAKLGAGDMPIRVFFFTSQYGTGGFSGGEHNLWDASGGSPAPRPGLVAFSAMTHFLEDAHLQGDLYASSKAMWALHFVRPDQSSVVAFIPEQLPGTDLDSPDAESTRATMILPAADFEVYDFLGRAVGTRAGGELRIPIQTWEARYFVSRRPAGEIYDAFTAARFEDQPPLFVNIRSFDAPLEGRPRLRVKVENLLPQTLSGSIRVTPPDGISLKTEVAPLQDLRPGETRFVEFELMQASPNPMNRYPFSYRAEAAGVVQEGTQTVQVACAQHGSAKIDGNLADWEDALGVTLVSRGGKDWRQIAMDPSEAAKLLAQPEQSSTAIYRLWTQWDDHNLYVAAIVPDESPRSAEPYRGKISSTRNMPYMYDSLQLAFDVMAQNPDDLLLGDPLYEKTMAADVDYEFCAARISNGRSELHRLKAPGTNLQSYYPTSGKTDPPLGAIDAAQVAVRYDDDGKRYIYEMAIPWNCVPELGAQVAALKPGASIRTHFAFSINDNGGRNRTFWTQEAGDLQAGSYGFSPNWGGGQRKLGGRIITDWGFVR